MWKSLPEKIDFYTIVSKKNIKENIMKYDFQIVQLEGILELTKKRMLFWKNVLATKLNKEKEGSD